MKKKLHPIEKAALIFWLVVMGSLTVPFGIARIHHFFTYVPFETVKQEYLNELRKNPKINQNWVGPWYYHDHVYLTIQPEGFYDWIIYANGEDRYIERYESGVLDDGRLAPSFLYLGYTIENGQKIPKQQHYYSLVDEIPLDEWGKDLDREEVYYLHLEDSYLVLRNESGTETYNFIKKINIEE